MVHNAKTFLLGVFIIIIPFLGIPTSWKTVLVVIAGLYLVSLSLTFAFPSKKPARTYKRRERVTPVFVENVPIAPSEPLSSDQTSNPEHRANP
jgi:hypothetical protein